MSKINFKIYLLLTLLFSFSSESCQPETNYCSKCNPLTDLCAVCKFNTLKPDADGGCEPNKQCNPGYNHCSECNEKKDECKKCESSFFPDENGGCSYTENCVFSYEGTCLKCKDDFYLDMTNITESNNYTFCKYKKSDDFKDCKDINYQHLKCENCTEGFFLSFEDRKCVKTENCQKVNEGKCIKCVWGYYLDATDGLCKKAEGKLNRCAYSNDGKTCKTCVDQFNLSEDGFCIFSKNCLKGNQNTECEECQDGYYLTKIGNICTKEKNCLSASHDFNLCEICDDGYYLEMETRQCRSNKEDFNYCAKVKDGECISCIYEYHLGEDLQCSSSLHCLEAEEGKCQKCEENYFLGKDNRCTSVKKCIKSNLSGECLECEKNYYFDIFENECFPGINQYKNCQRGSSPFCNKCKKDYYFSGFDKLCHSNTEGGPFYKCETSSEDGEDCIECIEGYYLGEKDLRCSKIENCAISDDENTCLECIEDYKLQEDGTCKEIES